MLKRGSDIIGLPVICLENGNKKGEIKDILFDSGKMLVTAVLVDEGGLLHNSRIIYYQNISCIGKDAIMIEKSSFIEHIPMYSKNPLQFHTRQNILDLEVITEAGQNIGMVQDLLLDLQKGKIIALILTDGLFHDLAEGRPLLPLAHAISFSELSVIVPTEMKNEVQYHTGGLKKILALE